MNVFTVLVATILFPFIIFFIIITTITIIIIIYHITSIPSLQGLYAWIWSGL